MANTEVDSKEKARMKDFYGSQLSWIGTDDDDELDWIMIKAWEWTGKSYVAKCSYLETVNA